MKHTGLHRRHVLYLLAAAALSTPPAWAGDYPSKPITIVVPFGPGSGTDQSARVYGQALSNHLKVPVVIDNKGGASGFIAAQHVAKASPDGYTLFVTTNTTQVANPYLFRQIPYDPVKDFTPIALLAKGQMLLLVHPDAPYRTLADLIAAARQAPGKLNFGSGSSSSHVASELLKQMTGIHVTHVPYKSNPQALADLVGGRLDFMFADAPVAVPQVQGGKVRALAASGSNRLASAPDVPTVAEAGVPGYDMSFWFAVYGPPGLPADVVRRLSEAFAKASESPEVRAFQERTSGEIAFSSPEELARFQAAEMTKWERVIRAAGIEPQ